MYCRYCGTALEDNAVVCSKCGATVTPPAAPYGAQQPQPNPQQPYQNPYYNNSYGQQPYPQQQQEDRPSAGFNVLSFFFPIVGLILFLVWKDQKPRCAHAIGKWALIGFIASAILTIVSIVLSITIFTFVAPSSYEYGYYDDFAYGLALRLSSLFH